MNIEIRDHHRVQDLDFPLAFQRGNDPGRQKMRADCNVRLVTLQKADKRISIQPIKSQTNRIVLGGIVEMVIQPSQNLGALLTRSI